MTRTRVSVRRARVCFIPYATAACAYPGSVVLSTRPDPVVVRPWIRTVTGHGAERAPPPLVRGVGHFDHDPVALFRVADRQRHQPAGPSRAVAQFAEVRPEQGACRRA
jgi:hypothetical protein